MKIYLYRNDEQFGPYSLEQVQALVDERAYTPIDSAWFDGCKEWTTISHLPGIVISEEKRRQHLVPPFEAYSGSQPYVFVSYAHADGELVFREIKKLHKAGYRIWYDEGIEPGNDWPEHIAKAVIDCSLFLMFTSPRSAASENCRNEVNLALNRKKKFLAVYLEETELPPGLELRMGDLQAIFKFRMPDVTYRKKVFMGLDKLLGKGGRDLPDGQDPVAAAMAVEADADYLMAPAENKVGKTAGPVPKARIKTKVAKTAGPVPKARVKTKGKGLWIGIGAAVVLCLVCVLYFAREETESEAKEVLQQPPTREEIESEAKEAIHAQYEKLIAAIVANRPQEFRAMVDSASQAQPARILVQWTALRAVVSLVKLKKEDFRIEEITFNPELTRATVRTSHREFGNWKRDGGALTCILENGEWRWKP